MKAVVLAFVLLAGDAWAQGAGSEGTLVIVLGPPSVLSLALDIMLLSELVPTGFAGRGRSITALVFATVGGILSGTMLAIGLGAFRPAEWWTGLSGGALALAGGTLALGVYGLIRGEPDDGKPEPLPQPGPREHLYRQSRPPEIPPQLFLFPVQP